MSVCSAQLLVSSPSQLKTLFKLLIHHGLPSLSLVSARHRLVTLCPIGTGVIKVAHCRCKLSVVVGMIVLYCLCICIYTFACMYVCFACLYVCTYICMYELGHLYSDFVSFRHAFLFLWRNMNLFIMRIQPYAYIYIYTRIYKYIYTYYMRV